MQFKKFEMFAVSLFLSVTVIAAEYETYGGVSNKNEDFFTFSGEVFRINPNSSDKSKNHIDIYTAEFKNTFSSRNGISYDYVSYQIVPKSDTSVTVFYKEKDALLDDGGMELFITEESMYKVRIPEFSWSGETMLRSQDKRSETNDKKVKDGEYILKINLLRYNNSNYRGRAETIADLKEVLIVVDTTPPKIDFEVLLVRDNPDTESYSYFISGKEEFAANYDYMAQDWEVQINDNEPHKIHSDFLIPLPLIKLDGISENDRITIVAQDDLDNRSERLFLDGFPSVPILTSNYVYVSNLPQNSVSTIYSAHSDEPQTDSVFLSSSYPTEDMYSVSDNQSTTLSEKTISENVDSISTVSSAENSNVDSIIPEITDKTPSEAENKIAYSHVVKNTLQSFCNGEKLDLSETSRCEFYVDQSVQDFVDSYSSEHPLYICFNSESDNEIKKIPLDVSDGAISFALGDSNLKKGTYHIFVSDFEDIEFRLGKRQIYSSDLQLKIVTKTGFDGRSLIDVDDIIFPGNAAGFLEDDELRKRNLPIINTIFAIISDNISDIAKIEILGYANPITSKKGSASVSKENDKYLMPLALKRAEYVKTILSLMGIPDYLMEAVPCGGKVYEFDPTDKKSNYQNRRVRINLVLK